MTSGYRISTTGFQHTSVTGPEFGEQAGHTLVIYKALSGLWTSGARWGEKFTDSLYDEGFFPCHPELQVWICDAGDIWEYICIYVDDLATCLKDPQSFFDVYSLSDFHR